MTVTVITTLEIEKVFTYPEVRSPEEAESLAMEEIYEEFGDAGEVEIVGMDSFETKEEVN